MLPIVAAGLVLAGCGSGSAGDGKPSSFFGVNGESLRPLAGTSAEPLLDRQLAAIERGGLGFVRSNFDWRQLQPRPPRHGRARFDFRSTDAWAAALARHRLRWYMVVVGVPTPRWAETAAAHSACGYRAAPRRVGSLVRLGRALAARYGAEGSFWRAHPQLPSEPVEDFEIWNEPNFGIFWCPRPQPARYARMLLRSARAIRAADPAARIVSAGLAGFRSSGRSAGGSPELSPPDFLAAAVRARPRLRRAINTVGIHSYEATPAGVISDVRRDRRALVRLGMASKPISLNESGWYVSGNGATPPVPEHRRAAYLRRLTSAISATECVDSFAPFAWTSSEANAARPDDWYGIASPATAKPYPSGRAFVDEVRRLETGG
jgi:hypothetical protein